MREPISKVFNMDCVEFMRTLPDNYFDLVCSDPPYGDGQSEQGEYWNRFGPRYDKYKPQITPPIRARENSASTQASGTDTCQKEAIQPLQANRRVNHAWGGAVREIRDPQDCTRAEGGRRDTTLFRWPY